MLLNDDVLVEPGCVEALVAAAGATARPRRASTGRPASRSRAASSSCGAASGGMSRARATTSPAPACASRARPGRRVGPFDEALFLYYEDVEWCLRARARGVPLAVALDARAAHAGGASSGGERGETWAYYSTRNRLWLMEQQRARGGAARGGAHKHARRLRAARSSRRAVAQAKLAGVRDWSERRMGRGPGRHDGRVRRRLPDADAGGHRAARAAASSTRCARAPTSS